MTHVCAQATIAKVSLVHKNVISMVVNIVFERINSEYLIYKRMRSEKDAMQESRNGNWRGQPYLFIFHSAKFWAFFAFLGSSGLFLGLGSVPKTFLGPAYID